MEYLSFLICPISGQKLTFHGENNERGEPAVFLKTVDGKITYPVIEEIPCLLPSMAIEHSEKMSRDHATHATTETVQSFYDQIGWEQDEDGNFEDALRFEDLRPVSAPYLKACHHRVRETISSEGTYLLDVASGPVQYDAYLEYHEGYSKRVCVDISITALKAARQKLGDKGIYILGDITNLPFNDDVFDGIVSLHTIYHVPFERQAMAFNEIHRVLSPNKSAAVVYSWGEKALFRKLPRLPMRVINTVRSFLSLVLRGRREEEGCAGPLYSYQAGPNWFYSQKWDFNYSVSCWRSIDVELMRAVIKPWAAGRLLLSGLFKLETCFSGKFGEWGQYPLIKIYKDK